MKQIDIDELRELLEFHSAGEVAKQLGVGLNTVRRRAKQYGIVISKLKPHLRNLPQELTEDQTNAITGNLLGDGTIYTKNGGRTGHFIFKQALNHLGYVQYVADIMQPFSSEIKVDGNGRFFYTNTCELFGKWRRWWYPNDKKIVPDNIKLNGRILYFWFLDDGTQRYKEINLYTNGFTKSETDKLSEMLYTDLGIRSTLGRCRYENYGEYWFLRVSSKSYHDFMDLVRDSGPLLDCMKYKMEIQSERICYFPRLAVDTVRTIISLYSAGFKVKCISRQLGVPLSTIEKVIYYSPGVQRRNKRKS